MSIAEVSVKVDTLIVALQVVFELIYLLPPQILTSLNTS